MEMFPNFKICSKCEMFQRGSYMGYDDEQETLHCKCSDMLMGVRIVASGVITRTVNFRVPKKCPYNLEHLVAN